MPLKCHRSHTFDMERLKPGSWALDAGARDLTLAADLAARGVNVIAVDADPDALPAHTHPPADLPGRVFVVSGVAVVGCASPHYKEGKATLDVSGNPYAFSIATGGDKRREVQVASVPDLMRTYGVRRLSLLKLDIEGAEYDVMAEVAAYAAMAEPLAMQVAVEYHEHCGILPRGIRREGLSDRDAMDTWYSVMDAALAAVGYSVVYSDGPTEGVGRRHWHDTLYLHRDA